MQVLVVAVQNAVPYEELGTATSGATFFRMIGGCFGTAVFGAIFANLVVRNVLDALHLSKVPAGFNLNAENPSAIHQLPPAVQAGVIQGIAHTIQTLFLIGVPIAFVAFLLSWTLPELELRKSIRTSEPAENLGIPEPRTSLGEIQRILERAASRENRRELYETLAARAGLELDPRACWMLYRLADRPGCSLEVGRRPAEGRARSAGGGGRLPGGGAGMVRGAAVTGGASWSSPTPGSPPSIGSAAARRDSMTELLEGWDPETHPEVVDDDPQPGQGAAGRRRQAAGRRPVRGATRGGVTGRPRPPSAGVAEDGDQRTGHRRLCLWRGQPLVVAEEVVRFERGDHVGHGQ